MKTGGRLTSQLWGQYGHNEFLKLCDRQHRQIVRIYRRFQYMRDDNEYKRRDAAIRRLAESWPGK